VKLAAEMFGVLVNAAATVLLEVAQPLQLLSVDAVRVMDETTRVRRRQGLRSEFGQFLDGIERHVARTGDHCRLAGDALTDVPEHVFHAVNTIVVGGFRADETAAESETLARQDAGEAIGESLVLSEHVADFARAHADVPSRYVGVLADVAMELYHEGLAEAHNLAVTFSLGVEVRAAFGAAHGKRRQAVLEDLFEAEEFEHAERHGRVETHSPFVGADRVVELDPPRTVGADVSLVVLPGDTKDHHAVGFGHTLQDLRLSVLWALEEKGHQGVSDLLDGLLKLGLSGIAFHESGHESIDFLARFRAERLTHCVFLVGGEEFRREVS
jgi:hypothetical protein